MSRRYAATTTYLLGVLGLVVLGFSLLVWRDPASAKLLIGIGSIPVAGILILLWARRREVSVNSEAIVPPLE